MMTGTVRGMQLVLPVIFVLSDGSEAIREVVVDTGFTGGLSLPPEMVQELRLNFVRDQPVTLADGERNDYPLYAAAIRWHDEQKNVVTFAIGDRPLLGTALLEGSSLHAKFKEGEPFVVEED